MLPHGIFALAVTGLLLVADVCQAGNKELIEQRVQELDNLNKQVVGQIENLPSDGQVDLKARVIMQGNTPSVEILEKKVTETKSVKEGTIDFKTGNVTQSTAGEAISKEHPDEQRPN